MITESDAERLSGTAYSLARLSTVAEATLEDKP